MSSPFRSELEQLQEQLRRAEERANTLAAEKAELEQMGRRERPQVWIAVGVVGMLLTGGLAYGAASADAKREAQRERAACEQSTRDASDGERVKALRCEAQLLDCRQHLPSAPPPPPREPRPSRPCNCEPGDPLCSCL